MNDDRRYHEARAEAALLRQTLKHYIEAVGDMEGVYFVDCIKDVRSREIASAILLEVRAEDDARR